MKIDWEEDWWLAAIPVAVLVGVLVSRKRVSQEVSAKLYTQAIIDARNEATPNNKAAPYVKMRTNKPTMVVLHQMSFDRGNDYRDYLKVTAHYIILPNGTIAQLYDHQVRLPASDSFNSKSVSIEFAGNFPAQARGTDPKNFWFPDGRYGDPRWMNQLTAAQARSGQFLLRYLKTKGVSVVLAHRQNSGARGNDPGPDVWGAVGEYGVRTLGMSDGGPGYAIDSGAPIKQAWRDAYNIWHGSTAA